MARKPANEMFETLKEMADDIFGDDDAQKETYITEHMKKLGYRMRVVFEDSDDDPNEGGDSFTSSIFGGGSRQRRDVGGGRQREPRRASGGGFGQGQYS